MASQADIRTIDNAIEASQTVTGNLNLSLWDRVKIAVVPESYAESIVNEIYGTSAPRTLQPDPVFDRSDFSSPNVYVRAKGAISDTVSAITGFGNKALITAAIFILIAIAVYSLVPALVRR